MLTKNVQLQFTLPDDPPARRAAREDDKSTVLCLTSDPEWFDSGVDKSLLAHEMVALSKQSNRLAVLASPNTAVQRRWLKIWLEVTPKELVALTRTHLRFLHTSSELHFAEYGRVQSLPVQAVDHVIMCNAEQAELSDMQRLRRLIRRRHGQMHVVSIPQYTSHWINDLNASMHRVGMKHVLNGTYKNEHREVRADWTGTDEEFEHRFNASDPPKRIVKPQSLRAYARDRLYVRTREGNVVPFELYPVQQRYCAHKRLAHMRARDAGQPGVLIIVLKSRRVGITTVEQGESYKLWSTKPEAQCLTLAHTDKDTLTIFKIAQRFHRRDPQAPILKGLGNQRALESQELHSIFTIATAGGYAPSRGSTLDRVHGSEVARWCNDDQQRVEDLVSGLTEAASHGEFIAESTPNGMNWFASTWFGARNRENDWYPIFLRWFDDPTNVIDLKGDPDRIAQIIDTLDDEESALVEQHDLTPDQLAWRRSAKRRLRILFPQEYPEDDATCFLSAGTPYFNPHIIAHRIRELPKDKPKPKLVREAGGGSGYVLIWKKPASGRKYVAGCDTSEGIPGCDPNGTGFLDKETGETVCSVHGVFKPKYLAKLNVQYAKMYNNALVGVERENHGHAVIQAMQELGWKRTRQLFHFRDGRAGWSTNSETRPTMLNRLADFVEENPHRFHDRDGLNEMQTFRLQKNGKFEADPGAHDDRVMKWAIAYAMREVRTGGAVHTATMADFQEDNE